LQNYLNYSLKIFETKFLIKIKRIIGNFEIIFELSALFVMKELQKLVVQQLIDATVPGISEL
jgi:hypothetical protein